MKSSNYTEYVNTIQKIKNQPYLYVEIYRKAKENLTTNDFQKLVTAIS